MRTMNPSWTHEQFTGARRSLGLVSVMVDALGDQLTDDELIDEIAHSMPESETRLERWGGEQALIGVVTLLLSMQSSMTGRSPTDLWDDLLTSIEGTLQYYESLSN